MKKFISECQNNLNKFVVLAIMTSVFLGGFSFLMKSVKAVSESDKAITAFIVPIQARVPLTDDFNSYTDGDLNGQGSWIGDVNFDIQGTTVKEGAKAVVIGTGADTVIKKTGTTLGDGRITFYVYPTTANDEFMVGLYEGASWAYWYTFATEMGDDTISFYASGDHHQISGNYTENAWNECEIEWRGSDHTARARINRGTWTDWYAGVSAWTALDTVSLETGGNHIGYNTYFDYIAEDPIGEETPTTSVATIDEGAKTIALNMPYGTIATSLVPTIAIAGESVSPASGVANNFATSQVYTVTAADDSTSTYTVTVTVAAYTAKAITAFTIPSQIGTTTVNEGAKTIALNMPYGTIATSLVPTIAIAGESVSPASLIPTNFISPVIYTVTAADDSTSTYTVTVTVAANPAKAITAFTVLSQTGTTTINESSTTIALIMPYGTDVTALVPIIEITGASVSPASGVAHDFTTTSTYTVTAADTTVQEYVVTVTLAANPAKDITSFSFLAGAGTITGNNIAVAVPFGTVVTALVPTITITGASVSPLSGIANDFTGPVIYTVTAADSSTSTYTVTVNINPAPTPPSVGGGFYHSPSSVKSITGFTVSNQAGITTINEDAKTIFLTMPYGADVTALVPAIAITGASVSPVSGIAHGFATPQIYTVTAADYSTQDYTVTVNIAPAIPKTGRETDWFIKEVKRTDIFLDGKIDVLDFNELMINWGKTDVGNSADVNQDGSVDVFDFNSLMINWGKTEF
jgi:hypothetical protein